MGEGMICTKCLERERAKGQRLCRECRSAGRRKMDPAMDPPVDPVAKVDPLMDPHGPGSSSVSSRKAETVTALRARIEELEAEVARLKRELAKRSAEVFHPTVRSTSGLVDAVAPSVPGMGKVTPLPSKPGGYHGSFCACKVCRPGASYEDRAYGRVRESERLGGGR